MQDFRLLMISAMYENGGNVTHRFLDGHPQMYVYPFESQLGTKLVHDHLTSMFPVKYRWPAFALHADSTQDYKAIIDEECKVRAITPHVSKFRHFPFDFDDDERHLVYEKYVSETGRSRANNVAAFFKATFDIWKNLNHPEDGVVHVGYSPIIVIDSDKIVADFPKANILHVVRNPWSAYADTKKRPVPLPLKKYMTAWITTQYHAIVFKQSYPDRIHILRYEDIIENPKHTFGTLMNELGLDELDDPWIPTWNKIPLDEVNPWGTIRLPNQEANRNTAEELTIEEQQEIRTWSSHYLKVFEYEDYL